MLVKERGAGGKPDIKARESAQSSPLFKIVEPNVKNKANCTEVDRGQVGCYAQTNNGKQTTQVRKNTRVI